MNRTKIEWCDYTWNPVTGCRRGCSYCYARRMAQRLRGRYGYPADDPFRPTFHSDRLKEPGEVKKPSRIFVCSQGELFAEGQDEWVQAVMGIVNTCPQHQFLFLTKNYEQLVRWNLWPDNAWVGASATNAPEFFLAHKSLIQVNARMKFVSFEPLIGRITHLNYIRIISLAECANWIIIGAMTGPKAKANAPRLEWVNEILSAADLANIPVFMKDNLHQHFPDLILRQEFPNA